MNVLKNNIFKPKNVWIVLIILNLILISPNSEKVTGESNQFKSQDNYTIYDRTETYTLANISFSAEIIQNNKNFTVLQSVTFEPIKNKFTDDWGIKCFYFATEKIFGSWSAGNNSYMTRIVFPLPYHSDAHLEPGDSITLEQNITAPEYWDEKDFILTPTFLKLQFITHDGKIIEFGRHVFFNFNSSGIQTEPVTNGKMVVDFKVDKWIALNTKLKSLYIFFIISLALIGIVMIHKASVSYIQYRKIRKISTYLCSIEKLRVLNELLKSIILAILSGFAIIQIIRSICQLRLILIDVTFFIIMGLVFIVSFISTYFLRWKQLEILQSRGYKLLRSNKLEKYVSHLTNQNVLLARYPQIKEIILLLFGALMPQIMSSIAELFI
ncbi:MAG: hypothetical protein ACTSQE_04760 [Candidatus Heimdallarchaeaceae archaeon]